MYGQKTNWFWTAALGGALLMVQAGCQQTVTPPAEETAAPALAQPESSASTPARPAQRAPATPQASRAPAAPQPAARPAPAPPRSVTLAAGTALKVRTTTTVSTKSHKAGDTFVGNLEEPLTQGNWVIAPKGAAVQGRVLESDPGGRVSGVAHLAVAIDQIATGDGQTVGISTSPIRIEAQRSRGEDAAKVGIATGIGAAIGAIAGGGKGAGIGAATGAGAGTGVVLATRGDAAEIGSETILDFALAAPVTVTEARE